MSRMSQGVTLLMLEVEKVYEEVGEYKGEGEDYSIHRSKKIISHKSREIRTALEVLDIKNI